MKLRKVVSLRDQELGLTLEEIEEASGIEVAMVLPFHFDLEGFVDETEGTKKSDLKELYEIVLQNRKIVILGPPGSGKTTMLRQLAGSIIREKEPNLTPIYVPMREYERYIKEGLDASILHYIEYYFRSHGLELSNNFFAYHLSSGGCIVMFDGLDEILSETNRIIASSNIEEFEAFFGQDNIIVVSSRVPSYRSVQLSSFEHFAIQEMNLSQIKEFISKWFEIVEGKEKSDEYNQLISLLVNDVQLLSLSTNPLMLSLICLVGLQGIPIPRKKADLYDICVKTLLSSWEVKKGFQSVFSEPQRFEILKNISWWFVDKKKITVTEYEISSFIQNILKKASLSEKESLDLALMLLKNMIERSGLFIEREPNIYGFVHRGLRDYLAALYLAGTNNVEDMFNSFLRSKLHNADYEQIITTCSRCLAHQSLNRASILVKAILNSGTPYEEYIHLDLALASECLFESGISYGKLANEIERKIAFVLRNGNKTEKQLMLHVFDEVDVELYDFLCSLISELEREIAVDLIGHLAFRGKIPDKCKFCDIALNLLKHEALSGSKFSSWKASQNIGFLAARGSQKALSLAIEIIKKGGEASRSCASVIVPLARNNSDIREQLLKILDDKNKSGLRRHLLQTLLGIATSEIEEKAEKIFRNKKEDEKLRKTAEQILKRLKLPLEEVDESKQKTSINLVESILQNRVKLSEKDYSALSLVEWYLPREYPGKILSKLPEIFETNRALAYRLIQMLNQHTHRFPLFSKEIQILFKHLSEDTALVSQNLAAYLLAEVDSISVEKNEELLIGLAKDNKEYVIARRAALNKLRNTAIKDEEYVSLLELSDDREVSSNLFSMLVTSKFDRNILQSRILEQIKKGDTEPIYYLSEIVRENFD